MDGDSAINAAQYDSTLCCLKFTSKRSWKQFILGFIKGSLFRSLERLMYTLLGLNAICAALVTITKITCNCCKRAWPKTVFSGCL